MAVGHLQTIEKNKAKINDRNIKKNLHIATEKSSIKIKFQRNIKQGNQR